MAARKIGFDEAKLAEMWANGATAQEVATAFGVSRQRAHDMAKECNLPRRDGKPRGYRYTAKRAKIAPAPPELPPPPTPPGLSPLDAAIWRAKGRSQIVTSKALAEIAAAHGLTLRAVQCRHHMVRMMR